MALVKSAIASGYLFWLFATMPRPMYAVAIFASSSIALLKLMIALGKSFFLRASAPLVKASIAALLAAGA